MRRLSGPWYGLLEIDLGRDIFCQPFVNECMGILIVANQPVKPLMNYLVRHSEVKRIRNREIGWVRVVIRPDINQLRKLATCSTGHVDRQQLIST